MGTNSNRLVLRDLSLPTRLVLAVFLIAVGLGYFSALVQLHFQQAPAGELLPAGEQAVSTYYGNKGMGLLERLVTADERLPFNGSGSMRSAFTTRSGGGWKRQIRDKAEEMKLNPTKGADLVKAEKQLRADRDLEVQAMVDWIHCGTQEETYEAHVLPTTITAHFGPEPDDRYFHKAADGKWTADVKRIIDDRCVRCHKSGKSGPEGQVYLDRFLVVKDYAELSTAGSGGMSLTKLAQTTHAHLLSFAMLFGLTGLVFTMTSYPGFLRGLFGVWTLIAQLADISCWWLGRLDPMFAHAIVVTGGLVAVGLLIQIFGSLFNMFGKPGKAIILLLILATCAGGYVVKEKVIDKHLASEISVHSAEP
jgi:hypothetical protein